MKSLIISADDYALSPAVDAGILKLIESDRLTATSCLVLSPRWKDAARQITAQVRSKADIGLHLDFTEYPQPLKHSLGGLIVRSNLRMLPEEQVRQAVHAQLDSFEAELGSAPDYIDGHQHVHQLPQIREALVQALTTRYPGKLPWIRIARPPITDGLKAMVIRGLGSNALANIAERNGIRTTNQLLGVYGFDTDAEGYYLKLEKWLDGAASGDVLMCHPATKTNDTLYAKDPIYTARNFEYQVFTDKKFQTLLSKYQLRLIRGTSLSKSSRLTTKS